MKGFKEKILSIALVITMLITMLPTTTFATVAQNGKTNTVVSEESSTENSDKLENEAQENSKEENQKTETEKQDKETEEGKETNNEENQKNEEKIDWPQKPNWIGKNPESLGVPQLQSGQNSSSFYAVPDDDITKEDLDKAKEESNDLNVQEGKEISPDKFNMKLAVFINGKEYNGGDITVKEGENFSYRVDWGPISNDIPEIKKGDYFTKKLFTVKGLKFPSTIKKKLIIDGINVGEMNINYDASSGDMTYKVIFTEYINLFDRNSVFAYFQGSSSFTFVESGSISIDIWGVNGNLTIEKNEKPITPNVPSGNGWDAPKPPTFDTSIKPFVKGVKWDNHGNEGDKEPQIEWRISFLEKLQKKQKEFLEKNPVKTKEGIIARINQIVDDVKFMAYNVASDLKTKSEPKESRTISEKGFCIIEDTLDENQEFYRDVPNENDKKKYGGAPFFIELPVMLAGTNHILNGSVGNNGGDGVGDINPYFSGGNFTEIKEGDNSTKRNTVRNTPLTYTILKNEKTRKETIVINCGKLGEKGDKTLQWNGTEWPKAKLEENIKNCQNKIDQIIAGQNSPISNLKTKYTELENVLREILGSGTTKEEDKEKIKIFMDDYKKKVIDTALENDKQITENDIPSLEKLVALAEINIDTNGTKLKNHNQYANYKKSLENVVNDQKIFLDNRIKYTAEWEVLKSRYERTLEFYSQEQNTGIYGFVVKIRSKVVKNTDDGFSNDVILSDSEKQYSSHKEHNVKFNAGIVGNYARGSVVLKKTGSNVPESDDLGQLNKANGLADAKFKIYSSGKNGEFIGDNGHLAYFLPKEASENKDAYTYTHTGDQATGSIKGTESELEVNGDGTLILNRLMPNKIYYAVETKAPNGYYVDESPIKITVEKDKVTYKLVPNVQRSIAIRKIDSYSKKAIGGAEFELYKGEQKITNFKKETINNHTGYYIKENASDKLITLDDVLSDKNDDSKPNLCIHGLEPGTYTLREKKAPDGYKEDINEKEYTFTFTIPEKFNEIATSTKLDDQNHIIKDDTGKDTVLENTPKVNELSFTKIDGNEPVKEEKDVKAGSVEGKIIEVKDKIKSLFPTPDYDKYNKLEGAYFSVFRFKGSETDWKNASLRENNENWEPITPSANGEYFTTSQDVETIKANRPEEIFGNIKVPAIKSDENGKITLSNIPKGHYTLIEVKAPDGYSSTFIRFYFNSNNVNTMPGKLKLFREINSDGSLEDPLSVNAILNFKRKLKIKLVKYDAEGSVPQIPEEDKLPSKYGEPAYKYNANISNPNGIEGVTYKLFMDPDGGEINPNPEEIKTANKDTIVGENAKNNYDLCKAVGVTDENGVLDITKMKDKNGAFIDGLHMGQYYLIEVATSKEYGEGYILDQTPIKFNLDRDLFTIFPNPEDAGIGITKIASNTKGESGIKIIKKNEEGELLKDAEFLIKDSEGNYLSVDPVEGKENHYKIHNESSDSNKRIKEIADKTSSDFDTPSKEYPSKVENYDKIPNESKVKTGNNGEVFIRGLSAGKEYQFVEIKAPVGYKIPENNTFKAKAPKTREEAQKLEGDNLIYLTKEIENTKLKGNLELEKIDSVTRKGLEGARFNLYKKYEQNENIKPREENKIEIQEMYELVKENIVTDENGKISIKDLEWGEYYIQETKAPEGYVLDESRYHFKINEKSFDENGNNISIEIPYIENAPKGAKRIRINKTNESNEPIKGAKFKLEKRQEISKDNFEWIPYGKEFYETDEKGCIKMVLPVGVYRLVEIETIEGHILDDNELLFEVKKTDKYEDEIKVINIVNVKADTAFYLKKTIGYQGENTFIPLKGVIFNFYDNPKGGIPLKFKKIKDGTYRYVENQSKEDLTSDLSTNEYGEIRIALNEDFIGDNPKKQLYYQEIKAPGNIEIDSSIHKADMFKQNDWTIENITNQINRNNRKVLIEVDKRNENNEPLEGAEFTLYDKNGKVLSSKVTENKDGSAIAVFTDADVEGGFKLNEKYYIKETKAPDGFVQDKSILQFTVDAKSFEQDENGNWTMPPVSFVNVNKKHRGLLRIIKVDSKDNRVPLKGAEFEIFKKIDCLENESNKPSEELNEENSNNEENLVTKILRKIKVALNIDEEKSQEDESTPETKPEEWKHYGEERYVTDENGEFELELPIGNYYYIERKAPFGYESNSLKKGHFTIKKDKEEILKIENEEIQGKKGNVALKKYNSTMDKMLEGAEFELFYKDYSDGEYKQVNDNIYKTDKNGEIYISNLPPGEYYLLEVKAPEGYELPDNLENRKHYFNIRQSNVSVSSILLNVKNDEKGKKGSVTLEKIDKDTKDKLKGAEFKLYYEQNKVGGGKEFIAYEKVFTTGEDGKIILNNVPMGRYYFEEIKAPEGYKLPEQEEDRKYYFEINGEDKNSINITVENSKDGTGGGGTITPDPDKPDKPDPENPDPDKPGKPNPENPDPDKPGKPNPENPDPDKPDKPGPENPDPDKPDKPDPENPDPDKPGKPNPENPGTDKPNKNDGNSIISKLPKTGDAASLGLASIAFVGAGTGLYAIRKKNQIPMKRNSRRRRNMKKKRRRK